MEAKKITFRLIDRYSDEFCYYFHMQSMNKTDPELP